MVGVLAWRFSDAQTLEAETSQHHLQKPPQSLDVVAVTDGSQPQDIFGVVGQAWQLGTGAGP